MVVWFIAQFNESTWRFLQDSHSDDDASKEIDEAKDEAESQPERETQIKTHKSTNFYDTTTSVIVIPAVVHARHLASTSALLILALLTILWQ